MKNVLILLTVLLMASASYGAVGQVWDNKADWDLSSNPFSNADPLIDQAWSIRRGSDPATDAVLDYTDPDFLTNGGFPLMPDQAGGAWGNPGAGWYCTTCPGPGKGVSDTSWGAEPNQVGGHGEWDIQWVAPDSNGDGSPYWVKIDVGHAQSFETSRCTGIHVLLDNVKTGEAAVYDDAGTLRPIWFPTNNPGAPGDDYLTMVNKSFRRQITPGTVIDFFQTGGVACGNVTSTFSVATVRIEHIEDQTIRFLTVNVATTANAGSICSPCDPTGSVTPTVGEILEFPDGEIVDLLATACNDCGACPDMQVFSSWSGDVGTVTDTNAATTTIEMLGDYTVTANYVGGNVCGGACFPIDPQDTVEPNCVLDYNDFADFADDWGNYYGDQGL